MVGHHIQYDLGVLCAEDPRFLPMVFQAYDDGRIRCTKIRQQLLDIASGQSKFYDEKDAEGTWKAYRTEYSLAALCKRVLGHHMQKEGTYRLRYAELDGIKISDWPKEATDYAQGDADYTAKLYDKQTSEAMKIYGSAEIADSDRQHRASWALHLMSMWGLRTDRKAVVDLHRKLEAEQVEAHAKLKGTGIYRLSGSKNMVEIQRRILAGYVAQGLQPPLTPKDQIAHGYDNLVASQDPDLAVLAGAMKGDKVLSVWMEPLYAGVDRPINVNYNVLVDSGRCSAAQPPIQQPPRKGDVRPCFKARDGYVYCFVDYDTAEIRALAQVCLDLFGHSAMADALRRGVDFHLNLAAQVMGIPLAEAVERYDRGDKIVEDQRQLAKCAAFGLPGGMSSDTFVEYAAGYGIVVSPKRAAEVKDAWLDTFPEMTEFFNMVGTMTEGGYGDVVQLRSLRRRGYIRFTAVANSMFQGLTADGTKDALYRVTREAYLDTTSALYGTRPVLHLHDEIGAEVPYDPAHPEGASAAADRMATVMIEAMQSWMPDVPVTAKPVLCRRWYKGAKPVRDADGFLRPSKPEKTSDGRTIWVIDFEPARA